MKVKIKNPSDRKGKDFFKTAEILSESLERLCQSPRQADKCHTLGYNNSLFLETFEPPSRSYNDEFLVIIHHMIVSLTISSYNSSFLGIRLSQHHAFARIFSRWLVYTGESWNSGVIGVGWIPTFTLATLAPKDLDHPPSLPSAADLTEGDLSRVEHRSDV
jgi:hypothetical protein